MNKTEWKPQPNTKKVENGLQKSDISGVKQSRCPWFLTISGEFGTLPGRQYHADIIEGFKKELEMDPTIEGVEILSLEEFQFKTGMIRVRPYPDRIDLTVGVLPNNYQLDALQKLENGGCNLNYEIRFASQPNVKGIGLSNLKKDLKRCFR